MIRTLMCMKLASSAFTLGMIAGIGAFAMCKRKKNGNSNNAEPGASDG
mgnify:CR=1 FL=1